MKTLTYLTTLLALSIQVMVNGQTQGNQTHVIRVDIMGAKEPVKMNYSNSNITISITEYNQLLEQANSLKINAKKLKEEALTIEIQSFVKQIEASEMSAKISIQKFEHNRTLISNVFTKIPNNTITFIKAQSSNTEAERFMKIAQEMREEANAQFTIQSKIGYMSNAEETEASALDKQTEVLNLFACTYPQLIQNIQTLVTEETSCVSQSLVTISKKIEQVVSFNTSKNTNDLIIEASEQAYEMKVTAQQLRMNALTSSPNQKAVLLEEAKSLENDYILKQMKISTLKSEKNYEQFNENRRTIALLVEQVKDETVLDRATEINIEAERLIKIAKEMREEANAQLTVASKFGAISNAEETVTFALGKQQQSIQILDKGSLKAVVASR